MPQKKNADSLELIRSKAGRIFGRVRLTQLEAMVLIMYVSVIWCQLTSLNLYDWLNSVIILPAFGKFMAVLFCYMIYRAPLAVAVSGQCV